MIPLRHPSSFRDPAGTLFQIDDRLIRTVHGKFADQYRRILADPWLQGAIESGDVVPTMEAQPPFPDLQSSGFCLEHERVPFVSYPSEWPLEMLCAAGQLTLDLALSALERNIGLKDATPLNVLFMGPRPMFVDLLSFEERDPHNAVWLAYAQFVRTFLLPALLDSRFGIPCNTAFWSKRDGIEPEHAYALLDPVSRFLPPFLTAVTIPVLLKGKAVKQGASVYQPRRMSDPDKSRFIIQSTMKRLKKALRKAGERRKSEGGWVDYCATCSYDDATFAAKTACVAGMLSASEGLRVLDVGCNTGQFSFLAASLGSSVVAIDSDPQVVGRLWQRARDQGADVLPLVVDLAHPTPALGWRNDEQSSFLNRATGYFDTLLMLAVVHHLLVTAQIPLPEIFSLAACLTKQDLIIEYVGPEDTQFAILTRGREELYHSYSIEQFESELEKHFHVLRTEQIRDTGRWIYHGRLRSLEHSF